MNGGLLDTTLISELIKSEPDRNVGFGACHHPSEPERSRGYSRRKAAMGSTRVARRAGRYAGGQGHQPNGPSGLVFVNTAKIPLRSYDADDILRGMGKTSQRHITTISGHLEAARTSLEALVTSIALWETRTSRDKLTAALKNPDTYAAFTKSLTPLWQRIESSHKTAKTELASAGTALTTFEGFINTKKANKSKLLPKFLTSIGSSEKFIAHAKGDLSALKTQVPAALPKRPIGV